jgi:small subunit ribosomal protein S9
MFEQEEREPTEGREDETSPAAEETEPGTVAAEEADVEQPVAAEEADVEQPVAATEEADAEQPVAAEEADAEQPVVEEPTAADQPGGEEPVEGDIEAARDEAGVTEEAPVRSVLDLAADARYTATGKRKTSVARVILKPGDGGFDLNGRSLDRYFPRRTLQEIVRQPLAVTGLVDRVDIRARIHGGGISSQADALRHGIAKALIEADPGLRGELKRRALLTRDPRVKERRKAGLKKARKRPQFSKR